MVYKYDSDRASDMAQYLWGTLEQGAVHVIPVDRPHAYVDMARAVRTPRTPSLAAQCRCFSVKCSTSHLAMLSLSVSL